MSNYATFNCFLGSTFSTAEQKTARKFLRDIRRKRSIVINEHDTFVSSRVARLLEAISCDHLLPELVPILGQAQDLGIQVISLLDDAYPSELLELEDCPFSVFLLTKNSQFSISDAHKNLCVVGSRSATPDAISLTKSLSTKASEAGLSIISGLASGVDLAAHQGCLNAAGGSRALAVLGNDAAMCFPSSSRSVYQRILEEGGGIISEYPPGVKPMKHQFIARNRIMAALCRCTVIVQAKEKSGALHTARTALELGREVAVLPWSLTVVAGRGSNMLLRDGAHPILCIEDLFALYPDLSKSSENKFDLSGINADPIVVSLEALLSHQSPLSTEVIKEKLGLSEVDLIKLELDRVIVRSATQMVSLV